MTKPSGTRKLRRYCAAKDKLHSIRAHRRKGGRVLALPPRDVRRLP